MSINGININNNITKIDGQHYNNYNRGQENKVDLFLMQPFDPPLRAPFDKFFDEVIFSKTAERIDTVDKTTNVDGVENERVKLIAHRGYTETAPENTIAAFIAAAENGYNTIECDVEWTKDGVPVILHDSTINRTARKENGWRLFWPRKCSNLTYEELLKYDFGSWYSGDFKGTKIPSFNELLNCANEHDLNLYIELKETSDFGDDKAEVLANFVKQAGLEDKVTWISFNSDYLKTMANVLPEARLGYLSKKDINSDTIDILKELQTGQNEVFLDVKSTKISEKSSNLLKNSGFDFEAWTVDDSDEFETLSSYDCKGITTDKITEEDIEEYYNR